MCLEATNSGKTLPPCLFPYIAEDLRRRHSVEVPVNPKCLMVTALNSIRGNMAVKLTNLGLAVRVVTSENVESVCQSNGIRILLLSPELLENKLVTQTLLSIKDNFIIKCVDECHLFAFWGSDRSDSKVFRPAMRLSNGELACLGGITLLQTATASLKTVCILKEEFPEIKKWKILASVPFRRNVTFIAPPPSAISSKFQDVLEPFIERIVDYDECHLILVRSINFGSEVYFHLLRRMDKASVAFFHR